jgi:hypothetical protein
MGQVVMFIASREQLMLIAILTGIVLFDGLVTRWTYRRRAA